jgi:hypothetical protein
MGRVLPILLLCAPLALAGCGGEKPRVASAPLPPVAAYQPPAKSEPVSRPVPEAAVMHLPGLDGVIGASAQTLLREFGEPRLTLAEAMRASCNSQGVPAYSTSISTRPTAAAIRSRPMSRRGGRATGRMSTARPACRR